MNKSIRILLICLFAGASVEAFAQGPRAWDGGGGDNDWTTAANWEGDLLPAGGFAETAVIDNGDTVLVTTDLSTITSPDSPPGGLLVSNNSVLRVMGSGAYSVDISGGTVDGSATFDSGAVLAVQGASASFASPTLSFAGGGVFSPEITSSVQGLVSLAGDLAAGGGVLRPTFGFSPAPQSWVLADAGSISGDFLVDISQAGIGSGEVLRTSVQAGGVNGQQLVLEYDIVAVLSVNVDSGAISVASPTGTPIEMTAYSIGSSSGSLAPSGWTSLASQAVPGWDVVGTPSNSRLEELAGPTGPATQGGLSLSATPQSLGLGYSVTDLPFQQVANGSVAFDYVNSSGQFVEGVVEYDGLNTINNLLLTVDPDTGDAVLKNHSTTTVNLRGYTIFSPEGSLKPDNGDWNSLEDQSVSGVDEASGSANFLSELVPDVDNPLELSPGESYALGNLFDPSMPQDLSLGFLMASGALEGDYNSDGTVDAADYTVWRDGLGTTFVQADYNVWVNNYGATGSGNGGSVVLDGVVLYETIPVNAVANAVAVPEAGSLVLVLASIACLSFQSRK